MDYVLEVRGLVHRYGDHTALAGVDLAVKPGECVALLGPNGAGKTTLVRNVIGLIEGKAARIVVAGGSPRRAETRRKLGVVQQAVGFPRTLAVGEIVGGAATRRGVPREAASGAIAEMGLAGMEKRRASRLSGGQQQRLQLAMGLVANPVLLVLDEPTEGLDVEARARFWNTIRRRLGDGAGVLVTTHLVGEAAAVADRVVVVDRGRVVAEGTPDESRRMLPSFVVSEVRGWDVGGASVLMLLALATAPFGSTAIMALPIYAAALLAGSAGQETLRPRLSVISALTLTGFFRSSIPWPFRIFVFIPVVMAWVIGSAVFHDVSRDQRAVALRAENRRVAHLATITERERIARDIHDIAGQALRAIIVRSQLAQRLAGTDLRRASEEADQVERIARSALSSIRESVAGWHQASLADELAVARDALAAAGTELETSGDWTLALAPSVENVLALGLREATTNIIRHASAATVVARIDNQDGGVSLTVADDGVGPTKGSGSGIQGMRERVIAAGGTVTFGPGATGGSELVIDMPFSGSPS